MVVHSVRRILGNDHDAEDTAQDVFFEAYCLAQTMDIQNWGGFLRRLATRRAVDKLRSLRRAQLQPTDLAALPDCTPEPYQHAAARELSERLRDAMALLPNGQAEVFALRYFEEQSYEEIAETLDITSNAVGQALHKARVRLQELLDD